MFLNSFGHPARTEIGDPVRPVRVLALLLAGLAAWLVGAAAAEEPPPQTLSVALEDIDSPRYEYLDVAGRLTGFHVEILRAVSERLGWSLTLRRLPWLRAIAMLKTGEIDALTYPCETPERRAFATFVPDNALHLIRFSFFIDREDADRIRYTDSPVALRGRWRLGIVHGYYYPDELHPFLRPGPNLDDGARNWALLMKKLLARHVDIAVTVTEAIAQLRPGIPEIDRQVEQLPGAPVLDIPVYLAFTRQHDGTSQGEAFAAAFRAWRATDAYRDLVARFGVDDMLPTYPASP